MIAWYLDEIGNEIETEDELIEQKQVIEKVVDKLIYQDQVFLMTLSIAYFPANSWFDCCRVLYAHVKYFTKIMSASNVFRLLCLWRTLQRDHLKKTPSLSSTPTTATQMFNLHTLSINLLYISRILSSWLLDECPLYCYWDFSVYLHPACPKLKVI